jgi:glycosyltransferase involved in cell wall biosynthesis
MNSKKFVVVANGRFHLFDVAKQLDDLGLLHLLITTMPKHTIEKYGISKDKYISFGGLEYFKRTYLYVFKKLPPMAIFNKLFLFFAKKYIPSDIGYIISMSGSSLELIDKNIFKKAKFIIDRSSTHPLTNNQLMTIAASNQGVFWKPNDTFYTYRELNEIKLADFILVPTNFVKDTFSNNFVPTKKLIQIPYAYRPTKFNFDNDNVVVKAEKAILFVGHLSPRKGIIHLLNAFIRINRSLPDLELWLVGSIHPLLKNIVLNILSHNPKIIYYGELKGDILKEKFENASIFCLPTYEEGMAYVLLEAQQFNLPIISTINSGVKELKEYDQNIFLVEPNDEKRIEEIVINIIKNDITLDSINTIKRNNYMNWKIYVTSFLEKINYYN